MISYEKNLSEFGRQLSLNGLLSSENMEKLEGKRPDGIVVFGMGGSGIPGIILKKLEGELKIPVPVVAVRDGALPPLYFKRPLFVAVSFSGDTEETIAILKSALKRRERAGIAVVTSGHSDSDESSDSKSGKLLALAREKRLPAVTFDHQDLTPREYSGTMVYGLLKILKLVFPLQIPSSEKLIEPNRMKGLGKKLAEAAKNRNILVYTDSRFSHLGYIWKTNFNETAKVPAFSSIFPELNHNEIAGFEKATGRWIIFWLTDEKYAKDRKIGLLKNILSKRNVKSVDVPLTGKSESEKTWNSVVLSHWVALNLAKMNKVDPRETRIIDELKDRSV